MVNFDFIKKRMDYIKKHWSNILFGLFIILMIIPQTRMPIQVFLQRTISFSPSEIEKEDRSVLKNYNWNLRTTKSETKNLIQSEGKVVLINYWATWCPPCIAEMPEIQELYNNYKGKVDFYLITNDPQEKIEKFLKKEGYELPIYFPLENEPKVLESSSLPTTFLISKNGEIVMKKVGAASWNSNKVHQTIEELLTE